MFEKYPRMIFRVFLQLSSNQKSLFRILSRQILETASGGPNLPKCVCPIKQHLISNFLMTVALWFSSISDEKTMPRPSSLPCSWRAAIHDSCCVWHGLSHIVFGVCVRVCVCPVSPLFSLTVTHYTVPSQARSSLGPYFPLSLSKFDFKNCFYFSMKQTQCSVPTSVCHFEKFVSNIKVLKMTCSFWRCINRISYQSLVDRNEVRIQTNHKQSFETYIYWF